MKKYVNLLSSLLILIAVGYLLFTSSMSPDKIVASVRKAPFASFTLGRPKPVDIHWGAALSQYPNAREKKDQVLDWMLMALISDAGLSSEEVSKILFDLPPVRFGYVQPVTTFEYESTRSRAIGDGKVVALVPAGGSAAEHEDQLAVIADEHRKNTGKLPRTLLPFAYTYNPETEEATLTRQEPIDAGRFFTREGGYVEATIESKADLEHFLQQTDDVTFASYGSALRLGGRRLRNGYMGVGLEDVAALWQAQNKIQQNLEQIKAFDQSWQEKRFLKSELAQAEDRYQRERKELETKLGSRLVNGAGFSLDPTYDFQGLLQWFNRVVPPDIAFPPSTLGIDIAKMEEQLAQIRKLGNDPLSPHVSDDPADVSGAKDNSETVSEVVRKPAAIREALANRDIGPFMDWFADKVRRSPRFSSKKLSSEEQERIIGDSWSHFVAPYKFQAARYDGDLQGTEAAMTLFYTDLAAKLKALELWSHSDVSGFQALVEVKVSPLYKAELRLLSNTRLWFGPLNRGFQMVDRDLIFAHNSTRIYAASSEILTPGKETEPNAESAAFLGWWNDHYDEVARFEPQYQRLNEIMKWSLIVSWLSEKQSSYALSELAGIKPKRDNWFPEWVKRHPELRYQEWKKIPFYSRGYKGSTTEALPILSSAQYVQFGEMRWIKGGVSLGDTELIGKHVELPEAFRSEELNLRAGLDFSNSEQGNILRTLDKTAYKFADDQGVPSVSSLAKANSKFRTPEAEMRQAPLKRFYIKGPEKFTVDVNLGGTNIGEYIAEVSEKSPLRIGFRDLDMVQGQNFVEELSRVKLSPNSEGAIADYVASNRDVESAVLLDCKNCLAVKLRGSDQWLKIAPEPTPTVAIQDGWQARADALDGGQVFNIKWVKDTDLLNDIKLSRYIETTEAKATSAGELPRISNRGPPLNAQEIKITFGDKVLKARKAGGKIYVESSAADTNILANLTSANRDVSDSTVARVLENGDFRSLARKIVEDPVHAKQDMVRVIAKAAEERPSVSDLNAAIRLEGEQSELILKRAARELDENRITNAIEDIRKYAKGKRLPDLEAKLGQEYSVENPLFRMLRFEQDAAARGLHGELMPILKDGKLDFHFRLMDEISNGAAMPIRAVATSEPYYLLSPSPIGHPILIPDLTIPLRVVKVSDAKIAPQFWPSALELPSGKTYYLSTGIHTAMPANPQCDVVGRQNTCPGFPVLAEPVAANK